jgi:hypothetical protein
LERRAKKKEEDVESFRFRHKAETRKNAVPWNLHHMPFLAYRIEEEQECRR